MALIEFENVSKAFAHSGGTKLLRAHIQDTFKRRSRQSFYALRNISFRVEAGESMAIIGRNGAGKSTLLSLVTGLCQPSEGRFTVRGRVAALLELGSGFHPDLTGVENVRLNASLLGFDRQMTNSAMESIAEFAGIGTFINDPLRTYSSGMIMRLAFAVAVHVNPDILIVDEILAVGDQQFQAKCFEKIREYKQAGKTLLFVSHGPHLIRQLCDYAVWLDKGCMVRSGPAEEVLEAYTRTMT